MVIVFIIFRIDVVVDVFSYDFFSFSMLYYLVVDFCFFFGVMDVGCFIEMVVGLQVEEEDVFFRNNISGFDLFEDGVFVVVDGFVLIVYDGLGIFCCIILQIFCKFGDCWDENNDFEFVFFLGCLQNCVYDSFINGIVNWSLLVISGSDEELIFDVYEMLCFVDNFDVCVLNRMIFEDVI